ncbi:LamG-like jellyroll fold domain-containing protein [Ruania alba]|uniref:Signal peptidase I n=1 Tax=Ruania alba TaxID=648782 RepID=A0A1H5G2W5_9MICO|nr:LamG-like jellyroll fold domain-containing protein [Ruania alba]SEE10056.1 signal peptidase I [Ruania alba]
MKGAPRRRYAIAWVVAGLVVLVGILTLIGFLNGYRAFTISSPSMGTELPVGSVVVTQAQSSYAPGEIITFAIDDRVYTHRVVGAEPGGLRTQGDLNGAPDGWLVESSQIIGAATWSAPGLGWLVLVAPWLLVIAMLVETALRLTRTDPRNRWWIRLGSAAVAFTVVSLWFRIWFNMVLLGWTPNADGTGVLMRVVNTGLFPLDAGGTVLGSGEDSTIETTTQSAGRFVLTPLPALTPWQWVLVGGFCLLPFLVVLLKWRLATRGSEQARSGLRGAPVAIAALATVLVVATLLSQTSQAAFTASITNAASSGTRSFFTCAQAQTAEDPGALFAWRMSPATATSEHDLTGQGNTGTYDNTSYNIVDDAACARDTPQQSVAFTGSTCLATRAQGTAPSSFSYEAWIKAEPNASGPIIGASSTGTVNANSFERTLFLTQDGRIMLYLFPQSRDNGAVTWPITPSGQSYNDSQWHHVVVTVDYDSVATETTWTFYVDGENVRTGTWNQEPYHGYSTWYWNAGCSNTRGGSPVSRPAKYFTGQLQFLAVYDSALSPDQVERHHRAGT